MRIKSLISRALGGGSTLELKNNIYSDASFFGNQGFGNTFAGVNVNYDSAMRHQDVYTCVRIKSESIGQLPLNLFRNKDGKRTKINSGREWLIFTQKPNPYMTWQDFLEMYVTSMELRGNFYAQIKRNKYGNVYEIIPFKHQDSVSVNMDSRGIVYYTYVTNDNKSNVSTVNYRNNDILHIKMNTTNGYVGLSPITYTSKCIGAAISGENLAGSLFENGARPSGVLSTDDAFGDDEDAIARLRKQWNDMHGGSGNTGKTAILEYGMKYQTIQMSAVDAQLLEQRKLSREQIASIFRIPSHMLNVASGMKYNSIEHNNTGFFRDSLMPLVTKLENHLNPLLPSNHVVKIDERQFVRGDREAQVGNVVTEIKHGLLSINEGRVELDREEIEGGDVFAVATNNLHFGRWDQLDEIQSKQGGVVGAHSKPDESQEVNEDG